MTSAADTPFAVLKAVILSDAVLVGCAGNLELAMHTPRALSPTPVHPDHVLPALTASAESAGTGPGAVAFLVAAVGHGVWCITSDGAAGPADNAWIGDQDAFEHYQRVYHTVPVGPVRRAPGVSSDIPLPFSEEELAETMRMANALHALERDTLVPSVGEAVISAFASARDGFRYSQQAFLAVDNEQVIAADERLGRCRLGNGRQRRLRLHAPRARGVWDRRHWTPLSARRPRSPVSPAFARRPVRLHPSDPRGFPAARPR